MLTITYFHTLYQKNVTAIVYGNIDFKNGYAEFMAGGYGHQVPIEYIVSIEHIKD